MPFLNKTGSSIGTSTSTIYTVPGGKSSIILELDVANISNTGIIANVELYDSDEATTVSFASSLPVPVGSSARVISGQKIVMNENDEIRVTSNVSSSVDVIMSLLEDI